MDPENKQSRWIILLWLLFSGVLLYVSSMRGPFLFDDVVNIVQNPSLARYTDLRAIWEANPKTRFLPYLSFALSRSLFGFDVWGYHVSNVIVHVLNSFWVYLLVLLFLRTPKLRGTCSEEAARYLAVFSASVFLCHPLQTQAVSYLVQRITLLAAFFYLGAVVFYLRGRLEGKRADHLAPWVMTVAAMFCKENACTLPLALVLVDIAGFGFAERKGSFLRWAPFLATLWIVPFFAHTEVRTDLLKGPLLPVQKEALSRPDYFLTQLNVLCTYLRLFFFPVGQNADHDYAISRSLLEPKTFLCFLILAGLFVVAFRMWRRYRLLAFSIFWFFLTLSVESSIFPIGDVIAEHRTYLPLAGYAIFLATALLVLIRKRSIGVMAGIFLLLLFSGMTYARNRVWSSEKVFWEEVIRKSPQKARGYNNLGQYYCATGKTEKGFELFERALQLNPRYVPAHFNLAVGYQREGKWEQALAGYQRALELDPRYYIAHNNRGNIYARQEKWEQAAAEFQKTLELEPDFVPAYDNLGLVYQKMGSSERAVENFEKAIHLAPDYAPAYTHLGIVLKDRGERARAVELFKKANTLDPRNGEAANELVKVYFHRDD
ncbi:MAG: tetratricopeptide repeat protein [Candidatus Omnitrophica bacterium]|nr:tetratricopeptide repeat protein [Candidatus Omnitrophota bacterium]